MTTNLPPNGPAPTDQQPDDALTDIAGALGHLVGEAEAPESGGAENQTAPAASLLPSNSIVVRHYTDRVLYSIMETHEGAKYLWSNLRRVTYSVEYQRSSNDPDRAVSHYKKFLLTIDFAKDGAVSFSGRGDNPHFDENMYLDFTPSDIEQAALTAEFAKIQLPHSVTATMPTRSIDDGFGGKKLIADVVKFKRNLDLPDAIRDAPSEYVFPYQDEKGAIVMVEVRIDATDAELERNPDMKLKKYHRYTPYSDNVWRAGEPDGGIPIYIGRVGHSDTLLVGEGPKVARFISRMIDSPREHLDDIANCGLFPDFDRCDVFALPLGAMNTWKLDPRLINKRKYKKVILLPDHDAEGVDGMVAFGKRIHARTFIVEMTGPNGTEFQDGFDQADPYPESLFVTDETGRHYIGYRMANMIRDVTFMTVKKAEVKNGSVVDVNRLAPYARDSVIYLKSQNAFIEPGWPRDLKKKDDLNGILGSRKPLGLDLWSLLQASDPRTAYDTICAPGQGPFVKIDGVTYYNTIRPSVVRPNSISAAPFYYEMERLFPEKMQRDALIKWIFSAIAYEVRIPFGCVIVSKKKGNGKSRIGVIISHCVGLLNVAHANTKDIDGIYNAYLMDVMLTIIEEMHGTSRYRTGENLKAALSNPRMSFRMMHRNPVTKDCTANILGFSNTMNPVQIEEDDRRWMVIAALEYAPKLGEVGYDDWKAYNDGYWDWLKNGGYGAILREAMAYGDYYKDSDKPLMTDLKASIQDASRPEWHDDVIGVSEALCESKLPQAIVVNSYAATLKLQLKNDKDIGHRGPQDFADLMEANGLIQYRGKIKFLSAQTGSRNYCTVMVNKACKARMDAAIDKSIHNDIVRDATVTGEMLLRLKEPPMGADAPSVMVVVDVAADVADAFDIKVAKGMPPRERHAQAAKRSERLAGRSAKAHPAKLN